MKIALCEDDNVQAELFGRLLDRIAQRLNMNEYTSSRIKGT